MTQDGVAAGALTAWDHIGQSYTLTGDVAASWAARR
jgi:hypothetical protein